MGFAVWMLTRDIQRTTNVNLDFADVHRNDKWQPYAAVTAAAFAKELLLHVPEASTLAMKMSSETLTNCVLALVSCIPVVRALIRGSITERFQNSSDLYILIPILNARMRIPPGLKAPAIDS